MVQDSEREEQYMNKWIHYGGDKIEEKEKLESLSKEGRRALKERLIQVGKELEQERSLRRQIHRR